MIIFTTIYIIEFGMEKRWSGNIFFKDLGLNRFGRFTYRLCPFIKFKRRENKII